MIQSVNTRSYDLFKTIVALVLLILLIWLLLRGRPASIPEVTASTATLPSTSEAQAKLAVQPTEISQPQQPSATPTAGPTETSLPAAAPTTALPTEPAATEVPTVTASPLQPSATPAVAPTEASLPTPTPTAAVTEQAPAEAPTATPQPAEATTATGTPAATAGQTLVACPLARPTRLKVGDTVRVMSNLNMRAEPSILSNLILTNLTGTELTIIGGPVCEPYQGAAYLWWQVQRPDGQIGWSAEGYLRGNFYFLEPIQ